MQQIAVIISEAQIEVLRVRRARTELLARARLDPEPSILPED